MAIVPSIETDPSEATPPHMIHLDSKALSTIGSRVEGHGGGDWGNGFLSFLFSLRLREQVYHVDRV